MQNRVQETTTTGGTGTITLAGAVTGYITFAAGFTTGDVLFYTIDNGIGEWEIGIGTLVTTGTLSRTTVIASSNSGALVNFSSGTKRVFCSAPTRSLVPDQTSKSDYVLTTDGVDPSWTQTLNSVTIGNTTPAAGAFTTLSASSTVSGTGFSNYLASPPAIGGTAAAAGSFTTLTTSSTVTINGGTANGVGYLNASKVLTTGTALTFDGANLGIGTSSPGSGLAIDKPYSVDTDGAASKWTARFKDTSSYGVGKGGSLLFTGVKSSGGSSGNYAGIAGLKENATDNNEQGYLALYTTPATGVITERLRLDSSGNLGLGVTPSAWNTSFRALQVGSRSSFYQDSSAAAVVGNNAYNDTGGTNRYLATAAASLYLQNAGSHAWLTAAADTAGSAINFTQAMTLTAAGDLFVNGTTQIAGAKLNVRGTGSYIGVGGTVEMLFGDTGTSEGFIGSFTNHPFIFRTNNTERARITSAGDFISTVNGTAPSLSTNGTMVFALTSNTNLRISVRGTDGTTRVADITLA